MTWTATAPRKDAIERIKRVIRYAQAQPAFPSCRSISKALGFANTSLRTNLLPWMLTGWPGQAPLLRKTATGYELTDAAGELTGKDEQ